MRYSSLLPLFLFSSLALAAPKVGDAAPAFSLVDASGKTRALSEFKGKLVVLEWYNKDCPFVRKHYDSGNMQSLQKDYTGKGVTWLSIVSSVTGKQGHLTVAEAKNQIGKEKAAMTALLLDRDGAVGKSYGAKTTPHMYIIGRDGKLVYQGGIDDKASADASDIPKSKNYIRAALDEALAGKPVSIATSEPYGCSVKY